MLLAFILFIMLIASTCYFTSRKDEKARMAQAVSKPQTVQESIVEPKKEQTHTLGALPVASTGPRKNTTEYIPMGKKSENRERAVAR